MPPLDRSERRLVLVVEDEPLLRMVPVDELEDAGFHVVEAGDGDEAVRALNDNSEVAAVLTDIEMPGTVNGLMLAKITNKLYPDAAVIVMSGRVRPTTTDLPPNTKFFGKPFQHHDLIASLHALLKQGR
jgi:CheY-like chemotaxis protein